MASVPGRQATGTHPPTGPARWGCESEVVLLAGSAQHPRSAERRTRTVQVSTAMSRALDTRHCNNTTHLCQKSERDNASSVAGCQLTTEPAAREEQQLIG